MTLTPDQIADLDNRAFRIFGVSHGEIRWPYEANGLNRALRRIDPERFRRELDAYNHQRLAIVEWAERYGLKASRGGCCPWWLTRSTSRRCSDFSKCASGERWIDHSIFWIKDGKPSAITASPYDVSVSGEYEDRVAGYDRTQWWTANDSRLSVAFGKGWYGSATTQVVMWRSDRVSDIEPAASDGGWYALMRRSSQIAATPAA